MNYILKRNPSTTNGTFGILTNSDGKELCFTLELPWLNNEPNKSCIPVGTYTVIPHSSIVHPSTWEITNVPGRNEILIHNANVASQLLGCIAVGDHIGKLDGMPAVLHSVATLDNLRKELPDTFTLIITNA